MLKRIGLQLGFRTDPFVRYTKSDNYLTIDFCVSVEDYETKYKVEQKFELGKVFLLWLDKGLTNKTFKENNPDFDNESFKDYVVMLGEENGWFSETITLIPQHKFL